MKVLLYFDNVKKIKNSGIGRALKHQIKALTSAGVEYTLDPKDTYDLAHINFYFSNAKKVYKKCLNNNIPVIMHGHSTIEDFRNSFRCWKLVAKLWYDKNLLWFYKHADLIITPTQYSKNCINNYKLGTEVKVISNGIEPIDYAFKQENVDAFKKFFNITDQKVIIGVGFPFERKGIIDFFEVAKKFPDITFIWFGALAKILTTHKILKAIKNKPSNVIMPGYIDNQIIKGAYNYASCLFFPTYEETEGIVVLEALASNCIVLIRDIGVYEDWLIDGQTCFKGKNNEEFVQKIKYILENDLSNIRKQGYKLVEERNLDLVGKELKQAYKYILNK